MLIRETLNRLKLINKLLSILLFLDGVSNHMIYLAIFLESISFAKKVMIINVLPLFMSIAHLESRYTNEYKLLMTIKLL